MFTSRLVTLAFVLVFAVVNVVAVPVPAPFHGRVGLAGAQQRDPAPFKPIPAYMKRDDVLELRDVPEDQPAQSDGVTVTPFGTREE